MDDEPMWADDHVAALTLGPAIIIPETTKEFAIKGNHLTLVKGNQFDGRIKIDPHKHVYEFLGKTVAFANEDSSNFDTDKIMARMDAMTMKMDAQYKEIQSRAKCNHCGGNHSTKDCNDDDIPMSHDEEAKFVQTFRRIRFYNDYCNRDSNHDNWCSNRRNDYNRDYDRPNTDEKYDLLKQLSNFMKSEQSTNAFVKDTIDVIDDILEEQFDAFLDEGSKILYSIEGTLLEDQIFAEFDEFMAMNIEENSESDSNKEEIPFKKLPSILTIRSRNLLMNLQQILNSNRSLIT
nr:reverse transcriptase domain-containing protein [Tanacetum cinerariifolium]